MIVLLGGINGYMRKEYTMKKDLEFEVKAYETVVIPKSEFKQKIFGSFGCDNKFCIVGFPQNLKREMLYYMIEYDENMEYSNFGLFSYVVSEDELYSKFDFYGNRSELEKEV